MPHWPIPHKIHPNRSDLSEVLALLDSIGNPQLRLPPAIHIAGTNGKGSTAAYLSSIFQKAGYLVHLYTSPHLLQFNERIVLAGCPIFDDYLFEVCERVRVATEKHGLDPTFFEATTAAAFLAFSEVPADILILETGIGGRLDATNVLPKPLLTIITPISYDHMEYLGPKLQFIAAEKAGIIKPGVPCVISAQVEEVSDILLAKCEECGSESIAYGYDYTIEKVKDGFTVEGNWGKEKYKQPSLRGEHQILNAGAVVAAIHANLKSHFKSVDENIEVGLQAKIWPARLQTIKYRNCEIIIDGAHNAGGAQVLALWIKDNLPKPVSLVLGMTKNRDAEAFTSYFVGLVDHIFCVQVKSEPSSYSPEKLAVLIAPNSIPTTACDDLEDALDKAIKLGAVVVTGSLFLSADVLKLRRSY